MAQFFHILHILFWSMILSNSAFANSKSADPVIKDAFETAMTWVEKNKLEAPAASRIYALTAITLHDSWHLSQGQDGYIVKQSGLGNFDKNALIEESLTAFFQCLTSHAGQSSCETSGQSVAVPNLIVTRIFNHLPYVEPTHLENSMPTKHSVHPEWQRARPLELSSASRFRPKGPPPEESEAFKTAVSEVKRLGEDVSEFRLADDSLSSAFWGNPAGTITPPGHWNDIALSKIGSLSREKQLDTLLALNISLYDAGIAAWDSKFHELYERPHELIRRLDKENPNWTAMGTVPLHPEYVSGHSAFSAAASKTLISLLGDQAFCNTSKAMWNLERCFLSFTQAAEEAGQSRVYGGLHYQFSNQDGLELGLKVGQNTITRLRQKGVLRDSIPLGSD